MPERTRKVPIIDIEKATTASITVQARRPSRVASTRHRMEQRGRREPRHQRGVLDRVPEPPAAPAELVIGPVAARGDAERQEYPCRQHPGPHRPRERGPDVARHQRADREGERDRQADIAEVERRRMEGEAGVLQQRVEPLPVAAPAGRAARTGSRRTAGRHRSRARSPPARPASRSASAPRAAARAAPPPAPATPRIVTQSSIEPSWFPHAPGDL